MTMLVNIYLQSVTEACIFQLWSSLSTEQPSEIGRKLLTMKLSDDLRPEVVKVLNG